MNLFVGPRVDYDLSRRLAKAVGTSEDGKAQVYQDTPYARLNPLFRSRVGLGNFNAHDAFMDCHQGPGCGGDGYKEGLLTWHNAWYLALGLNFTIGFTMIQLEQDHYREDNRFNYAVNWLYLSLVLVSLGSSASGIYAVGQSVDNVGFRPSNIMSEYGASHSDSHKNCCLINQRRRGLPMEADFANVAMQCLAWAAVCIVYLLHGWDNAVVAFFIILWMKGQMVYAQMARIRQNKSLNYLIGRIDKETLLASDTAKEAWSSYIPRLISLFFITSWHNVRLGQPHVEDYADVLSVKESVLEGTDEEMMGALSSTKSEQADEQNMSMSTTRSITATDV